MNARIRPFFLSLLLCLLAASTACAKAEREPPPAAAAIATQSPGGPAGPAGAPQSQAAVPSADRARIVTVAMGLRVKDLERATDEIRREVDGAGGYVEASNLSGGDEGSATMDVRVPASRASATRSALRKLGTVTSESETVQDVTEQRADLGARLHAARAQEERLLEIMKNKTGTIGDVIESEKELARVRENIEKLEAEQRTMESQIAMATLHLTLTTPGSDAWQTPVPSIGHAWHAGVRFTKALVVCGAMVAAAVAPTLLPVLAFLALLIVLVRRRERARLQAMQAVR